MFTTSTLMRTLAGLELHIDTLTWSHTHSASNYTRTTLRPTRSSPLQNKTSTITNHQEVLTTPGSTTEVFTTPATQTHSRYSPRARHRIGSWAFLSILGTRLLQLYCAPGLSDPLRLSHRTFLASQQEACVCKHLMKGCSASGDFDGDLDMVSFDPVLIDLVKATETGRDVHGVAFPSRGQEAWPKGLIHIHMCFEYIEPMVSKGLSWKKNTRKVVGSGRRTAREKKGWGWGRGIDVVPEKDALAASTTAEEATEACLNDVAPVPIAAVRGRACASAERVTEAVLQGVDATTAESVSAKKMQQALRAQMCAHWAMDAPKHFPAEAVLALSKELRQAAGVHPRAPGRQGPQKWLSLPSILNSWHDPSPY